MIEEITINWEVLGAKLARLSSVEQQEFFKGFTNEVLTYDTHFQAETQMLWIRDGLNAKQKDLMLTIGYTEDTANDSE